MSKILKQKNHKQSGFLTLMLVPYSSKSIVKFKIPHWLIHSCLIFIMVLSAIAAVGFLRSAMLKNAAAKINNDLNKSLEYNAKLEEEKSNVDLYYQEKTRNQEETYQEQLDYYEQRAQELQEQINDLNQKREELENKISADPASSILASETGLGLGGKEYTSLDMTFNVLESQITDLNESYDFLLGEASKISKAKALRIFSWPVYGIITSEVGGRNNPFGSDSREYHTGIDIAVPTGSKVKAAAGGVVKFAGESSGYGYLVIISHSSEMESYYGHNSELLVSKGDKVSDGDIIALSGNTGRSTGPHVHFEVRVSGQIVNPRKYIKE